jgi:hypothetical protein
VIGSLLTLSLVLTLSGSGGPQRAMPEPFQGLWSRDAGACGVFESDQLMEILENRLQFYESGADFTALEPAGDRSIRLEADWWDVNETDGDERPIVRRKSAELTLSPDRSRLTLAIDGDPTVFVRCPEI